MRPKSITFLGIFLVLVGLPFGQPIIFIPGIILVLLGVVSLFWAHHLLNRVSCRIYLQTHRAKPWDRVTMHLEIENDQPFPLPWLKVSIKCPKELEYAGRGIKDIGKHVLYEQVITVGWFERISQRFDIICTGRGEYFFGPVIIRIADPFGFAEGKKTIHVQERLLVYPRLVELQGKLPLAVTPFGKQGTFSWIFEDPSRFRGIREYVPSDPFSRIEWKATARTGKLHTRVLEASFVSDLKIIVNISTGKHSWSLDRSLLEKNLVTAASIIHHCNESKYRYAVFFAGYIRGMRNPAAVKMGSGSAHLRRCLETMARLVPFSTVRCEEIIAKARRQEYFTKKLVLITSIITEKILSQLRREKKQGFAVSIIYTGQELPQKIDPSIPLYAMQEGGGWDEVPQITLAELGN